VKARKRFGQHFLERAWVDKLIRDIAPAASDTFLEIGPGRGALTLPLAASGARIHAVDIDRDLSAELAAHAPPNVTVTTADFLDVPAEDLFANFANPAPPSNATNSAKAAGAIDVTDATNDLTTGPAGTAGARLGVRVVGNLPYNVSSPILFRLLQLSRETGRLIDATLMLQREVAARIAAGPGSGDYGPLSIMTAVYADVERRFDLPPGAFRPQPKVHSSVIRLKFRPSIIDIGDESHFQRIVRTIFQQRRKTMSNALKPALLPDADAAGILTAVGIDPRRRPETLTLAELAALGRATCSSSASSSASASAP
jgi:16S rRNA (adenine1518-N6/adenine1519-N6)-dimethyltransferase